MVFDACRAREEKSHDVGSHQRLEQLPRVGALSDVFSRVMAETRDGWSADLDIFSAHLHSRFQRKRAEGFRVSVRRLWKLLKATCGLRDARAAVDKKAESVMDGVDLFHPCLYFSQSSRVGVFL